MRGLPSIALPTNIISPDASSHLGMLLFIQYAFMPHRLEYCGTDDQGALFDYWQAKESDAGLEQILHTFTGALPYLKLIAYSNNIADPFDHRVVHAYWVGNDLLRNIEMQQFFNSLVERFGKQLQNNVQDYITRKIPLGATPHHSFHVFDVHSRVGQLTHSMEVMENCRISWGQITSVEATHFAVSAQPLLLSEGKLQLGTAIPRRVLRKLDDKGFTEDAQVGDWISIHWDWACDRLTPQHVHNLEQYTRHHIQLANLTL